MSQSFPSPYNFVPLTRFILRPDWADQVSHDHPFQDGWCGELELTLTAHTPLCVGGEQQAASKEAPGQVHFHRTPEGDLSIPGSSLKGMLRNVLEIATFAHFRQVEERRFGVRDITNSDNFYSRAIQNPPTQAGWLRYDDGQWTIQPCRFVRLHQKDLIEALGIPQGNWVRCGSAEKRYQLLKGLRTITFSESTPERNSPGDAQNVGRGDKSGHVVVTGQPGKDYTQKNAKKREFIFYDEAPTPLPVPSNVMEDFQFIHSESDEWTYWRRRIGEANPGIPVFYRADKSGTVLSVGLAMMHRLAYRHTLHDAISHTDPGHLEHPQPDLPELLFGYLEDDAADSGRSLRGRVHFAEALVTGAVTTKREQPTVLNSPKPTFYPAYLKQDGKEYRNLMEGKPELSGWKRYPVKPEHIQPPPAKSQPTVQVQLETAPANTQFRCRVRGHNLRDVELGALAWALDFGGRGHLRHSLGMGKPYGLGQVSIELDGVELEPNDLDRRIAGDSTINLLACREQFEAYMRDVWQQATGDAEAVWDHSDPLQQLLSMAEPGQANDGALHYPQEPNDFANAKKRRWKRRPHADVPAEVRKQATAARAPATVLTATGPPDFEAHLEATREHAREKARAEQQARMRAERAAAKRDMDDHERAVADIEDAYQTVQAQGSQPSKTATNALADLIRKAARLPGEWPPEPRHQMDGLMDPIDAWANQYNKEKVLKALKQLRKQSDE